MKKILFILTLGLLAGLPISNDIQVVLADHTPETTGGYSCPQPNGSNHSGGTYPADDTKNPPAYKKGDPIPCSTAGQVSKEAGFDLKDVFGWAIGIGSIVALGVITFGGTKYAASGLFGEHASESEIHEAKAWIWAGLKGLVLLIAAFLILNTINPNILLF